MNLKICLLVFAVAIVLLSVGVQAIVLFQASTMLEAFGKAVTLGILGGGGITPNGDGGDPVPGPGVPR